MDIFRRLQRGDPWTGVPGRPVAVLGGSTPSNAVLRLVQTDVRSVVCGLPDFFGARALVAGGRVADRRADPAGEKFRDDEFSKATTRRMRPWPIEPVTSPPEFWSVRRGTAITELDAREIGGNLVEFFKVLLEWDAAKGKLGSRDE